MLPRPVAAAVVLTAIVTAAPVARADEPAPVHQYQEGSRALSRVEELETMSGVEIVGGALVLGAGGALTTAGLWPCDSGKDCSTRGLGAALGIPLALGGIYLVVLGIRDRSEASTLRKALVGMATGFAF